MSTGKKDDRMLQILFLLGEVAGDHIMVGIIWGEGLHADWPLTPPPQVRMIKDT